MIINQLSRLSAMVGHVVSTHRGGGAGEKNVQLTLSDGSTTTVKATEWDAALRNTVQHMTPAAVGTFLLHPYSTDEGIGVQRDPVIAWALSYDGFVYPVTAEGVNEGDGEDKTILHADGSVTSPQLASWPTYDLWLQEVREAKSNEAAPA